MGLCASASKTSGEVLQSFYYKNRGGGGVYTGGEVIAKMNKYNWTSRIYNNTRQVKYRSLGVSKDAELWLDERKRVIWEGWDVYSMDGMEWMISIVPSDNNGLKRGRFSVALYATEERSPENEKL